MDEDFQEDKNSRSRTSQGWKWLQGANCSIYCCHFLSSWTSRMWGFSMGVFLISVSPESLQLSAAYGLSMGGAVLLLGASIGSWVDHTPRLRAAILTMALHNVLIFVCSGVILALLLLLSGDVFTSGETRHFLYAVVITLGVASRLVKVARVLVMERDWTAEMCARDGNHLAVMTSSFRRIDLLTKMLAPILTGQVLTYAGKPAAYGAIVCWSLATTGVELFLLRRVYRAVPALRARKSQARIESKERDVLTEEEEKEEGQENESNIQNRNGEISGKDSEATKNPDTVKFRKEQDDTPAFQGTASAGQSQQTRPQLWTLVKTALWRWLALGRAVRTYMRYQVMWAGLALACLYMTVLSFDSVTIGYAMTQGLNESEIGLMIGVGAGFGILATFTYPCIVRRFGLPNTGVLALGMQVSCLSLCVLSVWLPGSPFDLNSDLNTTPPDTDLHPSNCTGTLSPGSVSSNFSWVMRSVTDDVSCPGGRLDDGQADPPLTSVWVLIAGIVLARFGLWTADLTITQLFLEHVSPLERGLIYGLLGSLCKGMDLLMFLLAVFLPAPESFGLLVVASFASVCLGWTLMVIYAVRSRKVNVLSPTRGDCTDSHGRDVGKTEEIYYINV